MEINTFLMMGRPGAGKGTQGKSLSEKIGARIYSSGTYLRGVAKKDTFVGRKVKQVLDSGDLLPPWYSSHLFVEILLSMEPDEKIVFEGACRTEREAVAFDETVEWLERPYKAIFLNISDAEVEKRLALRRGIEGRADDASDSIERRIREYEEKTSRAVEFFKSKNRLIEINGEQSVENVHKDVLKSIGIL